jgi:hypothetical protein
VRCCTPAQDACCWQATVGLRGDACCNARGILAQMLAAVQAG